MSTRSPEDGELEALLARNGRLARAWREASREEPPPQLDDAVRAAARRAVHAGPHAHHGPFAGRWRVPLSIAAILVVSATLTLLVAERREHVPSAGLDAAPEAPATAQAPPAEAQRLAEPHAPAKEVAPRAAAPRPQGQSAAEPAQPTDESPRELYDAPTQAKAIAAPPAAPETPSMRSAPAPGAAAEPAQAAGATPSRADEEPAVPPAVAGKEASAGERDSGVSKKDLSPQAFPEREQARAEARAKSSNDADATEAGKRELHKARGAAQGVAEPPPDAKTWIERIEALRREGKLEEAGRSLQEFRRRYPDYPLPPELARISPAAAPR